MPFELEENYDIGVNIKVVGVGGGGSNAVNRMIETNIRSSTLIGILTATGIGYLFDLYYKRLDFASASLVVLSIVVLVLVIETVSNKVRKVIL